MVRTIRLGCWPCLYRRGGIGGGGLVVVGQIRGAAEIKLVVLGRLAFCAHQAVFGRGTRYTVNDNNWSVIVFRVLSRLFSRFDSQAPHFFWVANKKMMMFFCDERGRLLLVHGVRGQFDANRRGKEETAGIFSR